MKRNFAKKLTIFLIMILIISTMAIPVFATGTAPTTGGTSSGSGDVSGAIQNTWNSAKGQVQSVVNNVVFPVIDMILAVLFFVKLGTAYFDYRKFGRFEFAGPCILFACLIFTLTAPLYIWSIL